MEARIAMKDRREFLKTALTGAVLLGTQSKLSLADVPTKSTNTGHQDQYTHRIEPGKSRVVIARDPALHGSSGQLDEKRVLDLLDRAIASYTGRDKPTDAWKHILPQGGPDKVIGLKTNGLGGKGISSHAMLAFAIAERLQWAGIKPGNIIIWDRNARDLEACGFTINTDPSRVRCFGSDVSGYEEDGVAFGAAVNVKLSKILTRQCDMVVGLPILKDHSMSGVTFAMKNMYGVVQRPNELHGGGCNPFVADLNCIPAVREKVRFTIGDAMTSVYDGGPGFHPERLWQPNALIIGEDRVALDTTAWQLLERKRAEAGLPTFEAAGRPPRYIATAADADHKLGFNKPEHINLVEI
jgi:uncharacterized protein (DUF362 family)